MPSYYIIHVYIFVGPGNAALQNGFNLMVKRKKNNKKKLILKRYIWHTLNCRYDLHMLIAHFLSLNHYITEKYYCYKLSC